MQFIIVSTLALATLAAAITLPPAPHNVSLLPPHNTTISPPPHNTTLLPPPPPHNATLSPPPHNATLPPPPHNATLPPLPSKTSLPPHANTRRANANPININVNPTDTKTNPTDTKTTSANKLPPFQGDPLPTIAPSKCSTGHLQCCKIAQSPTGASVTPVLKSLNIAPDTISGLVGVTCTTIPATGARPNSCSDKALCCTDTSFGGKVALACNHVDLSL